MRVLHLVKTSVGAAWALRQVEALIASGLEVHVALPGGGPLLPRYVAAGAVVHELQTALPVAQPWRAPAVLLRFRRLVEAIRPDLIHSHFVATTLTMRLALGPGHRIPRIFQVPGPLHLEHSWTRLGEIATAGPADHWIGSCRWTCERYVASGIPANRVFLSYYGLDPATFVRAAPGRLRAELGIERDVPLVGMVAYMYPPKRFLGQSRGIKGHEDLIDALALANRRGRNVKVVFVGGAWGSAHGYEARVRGYAERRLNGNAVFLGTRNDVRALYADFDVAVHPSLSENVGGALESMLLEVPTIATSVGGFPDLITHGQTGWLVPPRAPAELAARIVEVLDDPARARVVGTAGRERAAQVMDLAANTRKLLEVYASASR